MSTFKTYRQHDAMDCGPTCLRMISRHHGRNYTLDTLRRKSGIGREGVSLLGISEAAEEIGFRTVGAKLTWDQLQNEAPLPCIVYWDQVHFVVVYKITKSKVYVADPAKGEEMRNLMAGSSLTSSCGGSTNYCTCYCCDSSTDDCEWLNTLNVTCSGDTHDCCQNECIGRTPCTEGEYVGALCGGPHG